MSLHGAPDWSRALPAAGGDLYGAYEDPLRVFAPPHELRVAREANGAPAISLDRLRINAPDGLRMPAHLTMRFAAEYDLGQRQQALFAVDPDLRVEPLIPRGGFLRFVAAEALDVPAALLEPRALVWSGAGSLTFAAQLDGASATLLHGALTKGLIAVTAIAELELHGVARRVAARATLNPAAIARGIHGPCTEGDLVALLVAANGQHGLTFEGLESDAALLDAAHALAERLTGRFARLAPAGDAVAEPVWAFDNAAMHDAEFVWDLSEPLLVPKAIRVATNPLDAARAALGQGFTLVHDAPVIDFATGLHVLTLHANLPAKRVGVLMFSTEVRVPPRPPQRLQTATGAATFREGDVSKTIALRLAPDEPVAFDYRTVAFVAEPQGVRPIAGPLLRHEGRHLTIGPGSFPVRFVRADATEALLDVATIGIRCSGMRGSVPWSAGAVLDAATPALAIAVPLDVTDGAMRVEAVERGGARRLVLDRPLEDCRLDLSSFPTAGPRRAGIVCTFHEGGAAVAAIECAPEDRLHDAGAIGLVRLTPAMPVREWRWLAVNPLRAGYCWRWFSPGTPALWSDVVDPAAGPLTLDSSDRVAAGAVS